jgi:DNA protecting protein DprA
MARITTSDAAALVQGGMRGAELRVLLEHGLDLLAYERLRDEELASLKLRRVQPREVDVSGCEVLMLGDDRYPRQLAAISSPPALLFVRGSVDALKWGVGVIGTRDVTRIGEAVAEAAVEAAGAVPAPVVSGMALGCDVAAHRAALRTGVPTVAVLACGVDVAYPVAHREVLEATLESGGAIVSEQPFGTTASPQRLMARNRIIVGLSACVIPCEAGAGSRGTLQAVGTTFAEGRFVITARTKPGWRSMPGAWFSEQLARGGLTSGQTGWSEKTVTAARNGAHGVVETREELAEFVRFAVLFQQA